MRVAWPIYRLLEGLVEDGSSSSQIITGIACDSREVNPGTLFVAIEGFETDGHRYIDDAVKRGASAVIVQTAVEVTGIPVHRVENSRRILALLASRFYAGDCDAAGSPQLAYDFFVYNNVCAAIVKADFRLRIADFGLRILDQMGEDR